MYIEELSREKVLRDPVHDYIHIQHRVILDLINSREMQRLLKSMNGCKNSSHVPFQKLLEKKKSKPLK